MPLPFEDPADPHERVARQLAAALIYEGIVEARTSSGPDGTFYVWSAGGWRWRARGAPGPFGRPRLVHGGVAMRRAGRWVPAQAADLVRAVAGEGADAGRLAAELADTVAACARAERQPRPPSRRGLGFAALEAALDEGHPYHPSFKARTGFSARDHDRYGSCAAAPFRLVWLLVPRERLTLRGTGAGAHFWTEALGARGHRCALRRLAARGVSPARFGLLPVHPFQWTRLRATLAPHIERGEIVVLGRIGDRYGPSQSLRTVINVDRPRAANVKLPLDITNTSSVRTLEPHWVASAPALSAWLSRIVKSDPILCQRFPLLILEEHASVVFDRDGLLAPRMSALWRTSVLDLLRDGERAVPFTALTMIERDGRPFVDDAIRRHGLSRWIDRLVDVAVVPVWHLLVRHGIATEAHGQNMVLLHEDGWPTRLALRDFHDSVEYVADFLPANSAVPDFRALDPAYRDATPDRFFWMHDVEALRWLVMDTLFVFNLTELSLLLREGYGLPESAFWRRLARRLDRHAREEGLGQRLARLGHAAPRIAVESLVSRKLFCTAAEASHHVPNPFHIDNGPNNMIEIEGHTYDREALDRRLAGLAGGAPLALQPDHSYAVCHADPAVALAAFFAIREAGASILPIHPATPPAAARRLATAAGCSHLLYADAPAETLEPDGPTLPPGRLVQMTSGTTAAPKPVARPYEEVEEELRSYCTGFPAANAMTPVVACPTTHSYGLICGVLAGLLRERTPVVMRPDHPGRLLRRLHEAERPLLYASPAVLQVLSRLLGDSGRLHAAMTSGTLLPAPWFAAIRRCTDHLFQQYGTSESGVVAVNVQTQRPGDVGHLLAHHTLAQEGAPDAPVEIRVRTPWREVATRDLGYRTPEGMLVFLSRLDDTINVAGLNVYPKEVEDVALAMPGVADAVAVRQADPFAGERVALVFSAARAVSEAQLRAWCAARLAAHQMPVALMRVEEVPRLANGKISRRDLAATLAGPAAETA